MLAFVNERETFSAGNNPPEYGIIETYEGFAFECSNDIKLRLEKNKISDNNNNFFLIFISISSYNI
jgi:hypothetical protein